MNDRRTMTNESNYVQKASREKQNLYIENRQKVVLTGVINVDSFNEEEMIIETDLGMLTIKGANMHINKLSLETGDLVIDGDINVCEYSEKKDIKAKGKGILSNLFK